MMKKILLLCAFALSQGAHACTCEAGMDTRTLVQAKNVFVFRLLRAEMKPARADEEIDPQVIGEIEITEQLRGNTSFRQVEFSTNACCGARLDVGRYFLVAKSGAGSRLYVNGHDLIEVGGKAQVSVSLAEIRAVMNGKQELDAVFQRNIRDRTEQVPVLPPCPRR